MKNLLEAEGVKAEVAGESQGSFASVLGVNILVRASDEERCGRCSPRTGATIRVAPPSAARAAEGSIEGPDFPAIDAWLGASAGRMWQMGVPIRHTDPHAAGQWDSLLQRPGRFAAVNADENHRNAAAGLGALLR